MAWPPTDYPYIDNEDTVLAATVNDTIAKIIAHLEDETAVHGITDTSDLVLSSGLAELVQDYVAAMFSDGTQTGATVTYNDTTGSISIEVTATGAQGAQGIQGPIGLTGPPGPRGAAGDSLAAFSGGITETVFVDSGSYILTGKSVGIGAVTAEIPETVDEKFYFFPFSLSETITVDAWDVPLESPTSHTGSPNMRIGIYSDDGSGMPTGVPLLDSVADITTGEVTVPVTFSALGLTAGRYWLCWGFQGLAEPTSLVFFDRVTQIAPQAAVPANETDYWTIYTLDNITSTLPTNPITNGGWAIETYGSADVPTEFTNTSPMVPHIWLRID